MATYIANYMSLKMFDRILIVLNTLKHVKTRQNKVAGLRTKRENVLLLRQCFNMFCRKNILPFGQAFRN